MLKLREAHKNFLRDTEKIDRWYEHSEKREKKTREDIAREEAEIAADRGLFLIFGSTC